MTEQPTSRPIPERDHIEYSREFALSIPPGAIPTFAISIVTYPNLFGGVLNVTSLLNQQRRTAGPIQ